MIRFSPIHLSVNILWFLKSLALITFFSHWCSCWMASNPYCSLIFLCRFIILLVDIWYWNFFSFTEHAFDCQRQAFKLSELFIRSEDNQTTDLMENSESLKACLWQSKACSVKEKKFQYQNSLVHKKPQLWTLYISTHFGVKSPCRNQIQKS